jgi:phenylalanyl-tRNA synthetase beta chain
MNIKITYNFLLDYLETDATAYDLQKYLSLCGPSVETVEPIYDALGNIEDYVLDIEITSNRVDMASVFGVARESVAILPQFGKKAKLKLNPQQEFIFENLNAEPIPLHKINVKIQDPTLCPRFAALGFSIEGVSQAPDFIKKRLELCDIRSINVIVDISNYIMLALGQPTHMFDLDKIAKKTLILRRSKTGENITTLDSRNITLPGDDIVIEDGEGRLIDLCGIMGGQNSEISNDTTKVLFFVQTYHKKHIRQTSMKTGQRSMAATYFEKGLDPNNVETALVYGTHLLNKFAKATCCTDIIDMYKHKVSPSEISLSISEINKVMGIELEELKIKSILEALGFEVKNNSDKNLLHIKIPTSRVQDVSIKEDIIEEVARIYGYHNLPNNIPPLVYVKQPKELEMLFKISDKIKKYLKHLGLNEFLQYSMVSEDLLADLELDPKKHLKIANTISKEIEYMRSSLLPSMIQAVENNEGKRENLKFFEIAKVYLPQEKNLPKEESKLAIVSNESFFDTKGIVEGILTELAITNVEFISCSKNSLMIENEQAEIFCDTKSVGFIGRLKTKFKNARGIKKDIHLAELDLETLAQKAGTVMPFAPVPSFAVIKRDLTLKLGKKTYAEFEQKARSISTLLYKIELIDIYNESITLRLYFTSQSKNITEEDVSADIEKISTIAS